MAIKFNRIYFKYTKCLIITALIAFFVQLLIAINYFPPENGTTFLQNNQETKNLPSKANIKDVAKADHTLQELGFKPICSVKSKEALSAINRAKTKSCKEEIVNKTCLIQHGKFYPEVLTNSCPRRGATYGKNLGCYQDEKKLRLLSSFYGNYGQTNSPTACLNICVQAGFPYAGLQYASECFCGENPPPSSSKIDDSFCDMKCPGDKSNYCGGYFTMNIFETGIPKFNPKLPKTFGNKETVRIIFLLTLNGRALRQVYRLINALYRTSHYFYIHIDARQDYLHRQLLPLEDQFPNIKLATRRYSTIWGGASLLQMLLASMSEFFQLGWKWDYVINLSESDFPIKSLENLETFLSLNKGLNFVKSHGREVQRFIKKQGLDKSFIECDTHMWRIGERKLPRGIVIDGGSDWVALSPEFVSYIIHEHDDLLEGLDTIFRHTLLPAESFFHTVLRNSKYCETYVDNNLHVTNWKRKFGCNCQYKHVVDWCGCSPNVFRVEDWPRIQSTQDRQLFFARKFEAIINQEIIARVEQSIGINDLRDVYNFDAYWQSIYNQDDLTNPSHDLTLTHAGSIVRRNAKILSEKDCQLEPREIIEINSYNYADVYKGNLILHRATIGNKQVLIETWYKPQKHLDFRTTDDNAELVKIFKVSSEYDQKEQLFRNFANVLGPLSEPALAYQFYLPSNKSSKNFSIVWLDPTGVIAEMNDIYIDSTNLTNFVKSTLKTPLLPGIWKVGLFDDNELIVETQFLISPLETYFGRDLTEQQISKMHYGSQSSYKNYSNLKISGFVPSSDKLKELKRVSLSNTYRMNIELLNWIDSLNNNFYNILGTCIIFSNGDNQNYSTCGKHLFENCALTKWSSVSFDPKGRLGTLNASTGRLERNR